MAHNIEVRDGQASMFYAGETPWHRLGTAVEREVTAGAAIRLAGLDWQVEKRPMYIAGQAQVDGIPVVGPEVPEKFAVVRKDDSRVLGVVGSAYECIQNAEAFGFLDGLVGEGLAMFHTAGSLFGGRKIFITCKLPESMNVGPDRIDKYLLLATGHDGNTMMQVKWTPIRVVCWNTLSAALRVEGGMEKAADAVWIVHRGKCTDQMKKAREILGLTNLYYQRLGETFEKLRQCKVRDCDVTRFLNRMIPDGQKADGTPLDRTKSRDVLRHFYRNGTGNDHPDVAGTKWALWNGVTEYVDHGKQFKSTRNGDEHDQRMNSVLWGTGSALKRKALDLLLTA